MNILYVAIGGASGSVLRFMLSNLLNSSWNYFPLGTFSANVLGSMAAGFLLPLAELFPEWVRPLLIVGFLGGFTTMSSFSTEVSSMIIEKKFSEAAIYWAATSMISLISCLVGAYLISLLLRST